ncbi:hypothetical protein CLAFUW4_04236 [Fulvia fulva]|uniref:Uncharacterized protein n=1 Tax=Passalora fulva TaxID=5499 RepID=A0A9Q8LFV6_PASFU|nr:uncharacterized protein CLAFUR5_04202 [Fulvia fulva]KAK4626926.1 hypothetical protein CLAFUR4_04222 [Fulvia fulva]KAK4628619.1 hypothetical protein CLAFUR0_04224 [Fulvia fulva]UJO16638.1 hypothetical protein CLAFUR5_04202 [Fulvia fulva]WPV13661.1 hypothetical protein CLAFUW4_04236 [Fulvia fulva]WPV28801.1 hypothetical protein CLAFUW7_04225 [Fulvia fulva]
MLEVAYSHQQHTTWPDQTRHTLNMANQAPKNSVWSAMDYKPPKGKCGYKTSILSSCPCLRFMLHPVKAATSFDCDGCGHHASFHSLENESEDAVLKKWAEQEANSNASQAAGRASKKRRRIAEKPTEEEVEIFELLSDAEEPDWLRSSTRSKAAKQPQKRSNLFGTARNAGVK